MFLHNHFVKTLAVLLVISELCAFVAPTSLVGPFGPARFLYQLTQGGKPAFEKKLKDDMHQPGTRMNPHIVFACENSRRNFEAQGGLAGYQRREFKALTEGYRRSAVFAGIFLLGVLFAVGMFIGQASQVATSGIEEQLLEKIRQRRSNHQAGRQD